MALTDAAVRNAKPNGDKAYKLSDEKGLYLIVTANGGKWWRLDYRHDGKRKTLSLGTYPETTLKEAREKRDEARKAVSQGIDPSRQRRVSKLKERIARENSFENIAKEWAGRQANRWTPDHHDRVVTSLAADIFPELGEFPVNEITAQDLLKALRKIEARGAHETAGRVLQRCGAVFKYAIVTGRCTYNPAADLRGSLTPVKVTHRAALKASEMPEFLDRLANYDGHVQTRLAIQLLMLTFVRPGELRGAAWQEFDFDLSEWRIPAERMKMRDEHIVPLSRQAVDVLHQLHVINGAYPLVFPGANKPHQPMSENTVLFALYRMGYHGRATGHGFRATASTILNELGYNHDAIERQLAHAPRDKIRAAYNRAQYLPERRKLMQDWADIIDGFKNGAKVIPIRRNG
ncbi:integrase arm-type DNA-binding domain-containing protein [Methylococcus sp. ANG]|uniref:tyrosine-type recombinase/integrase n=1 Tax=Methylococcus sp. ANG TaxID=3231903 RepID=UPI00345A3C60